MFVSGISFFFSSNATVTLPCRAFSTTKALQQMQRKSRIRKSKIKCWDLNRFIIHFCSTLNQSLWWQHSFLSCSPPDKHRCVLICPCNIQIWFRLPLWFVCSIMHLHVGVVTDVLTCFLPKQIKKSTNKIDHFCLVTKLDYLHYLHPCNVNKCWQQLILLHISTHTPLRCLFHVVACSFAILIKDFPLGEQCIND